MKGKLGTKERGDGEERENCGRRGSQLEDQQCNISFCQCPKHLRFLVNFNSRTRFPGPSGDAATNKADPFTTLRTVKEQIPLRFSRKFTTTFLLRERFPISSSSSCLKFYISSSYGAIEICEKVNSAQVESCSRNPCLDDFLSLSSSRLKLTRMLASVQREIYATEDAGPS
jgi:hypothetical protein